MCDSCSDLDKGKLLKFQCHPDIHGRLARNSSHYPDLFSETHMSMKAGVYVEDPGMSWPFPGPEKWNQNSLFPKSPIPVFSCSWEFTLSIERGLVPWRSLFPRHKIMESLCTCLERDILHLGRCVFKNSKSMLAEHGRENRLVRVADMAAVPTSWEGCVVLRNE